MGSLISTLGDSVETNMGMDQMTQLINQQLSDGNADELRHLDRISARSRGYTGLLSQVQPCMLCAK